MGLRGPVPARQSSSHTASATSSRTACSLKTDIQRTASECMSTEHCDPSDAVRALWLAQLTERTGREVVADEELLQCERVLNGFDNCVTTLLRCPPWIA